MDIEKTISANHDDNLFLKKVEIDIISSIIDVISLDHLQSLRQGGSMEKVFFAIIDKTDPSQLDKVHELALLRDRERGIVDFSSDMLDSLIKNNTTPAIITLDKRFDKSVSLISQEKFSEICDRGGWGYFHKTMGSLALLRFSRPGLNKNENRAILHYGSFFGELSAHGEYLFLELKDGNWNIVQSRRSFIC